MYLCACLGGLLVIGFAADIGVELAGLDVTTATSAVSVIALFNLVGRLLCGTLSDRVGHINMIIAMFFITAVMMVGLSLFPMDKALFFILLAGIALCFGGFTSVFPAILGDLYGTQNIGGNIGLIYQAYGAAALMSPVVISLADGLRSTFMITAVIAGAGMLMSCMLLIATDKTLVEKFYRPLLSS
ncbi:MFS transporter [Endozoicomonas sp. Mp262]|uniref:MFS transporter n=1 Tax=Endozoicomonas sp. Mp262 TaxID=2919499 RepID=UPI0021DFBBD0